ncbi:hypothetical protein [Hymenobacter sp. B81]|uniref:hypothetical protein n=1 Tax=Hymenobacter sp. B81 TaxID=3344878 RepID=UPI0037DC71B5
MSALSLLLHFTTTHRFLLVPLGLVVLFAAAWVLRLDLRGRGRLVLLYGVLLVLNVFAGPRLNAWFLHRYGIWAEALVTHQEGTYRRYNKHPVLRCWVLLRRPGAGSAQSSFDTDDFNLYPAPPDGYQYPAPGQPFTVRYVPGAEANFVILGDDPASAFVRQQQCTGALQQLSQAARQYQFDSADGGFRAEYRAQLTQYLRRRCGNPGLDEHYAHELRRLARPPAAR